MKDLTNFGLIVPLGEFFWGEVLTSLKLKKTSSPFESILTAFPHKTNPTIL